MDDEEHASIDAEVDAYASQNSPTPTAARDAIRTILEGARSDDSAHTLTRRTREAYAVLFAKSGLGLAERRWRACADQEEFDPEAIVEDASRDRAPAPSADAPGLLGFGDGLRRTSAR